MYADVDPDVLLVNRPANTSTTAEQQAEDLPLTPVDPSPPPKRVLTPEQVKLLAPLIPRLIDILGIKPTAKTRREVKGMVRRITQRVNADPGIARCVQLQTRVSEAEARLAEAQAAHQRAKQNFTDSVLSATPADLPGLRAAITLTAERLDLATEELTILREAAQQETEQARKQLPGIVATSFDTARTEPVCQFPSSARDRLQDAFAGPLFDALQKWVDGREGELQLARTRESYRRQGLDLAIFISEVEAGHHASLGTDNLATEFLDAMPKL